MWFKNKTGCEKADSPLAARLTWPHKQFYTRVASVFGSVSLEALRRRLSAVLPLSAGIHRKGSMAGSPITGSPGFLAFGGPTSVTLKARWRVVALRLCVSVFRADLPCTKEIFCLARHYVRQYKV